MRMADYYSDFPELFPVLFARSPGLLIEAGSGWRRHLLPLLASLEARARNSDVRLLQVKEKLGALRVYYKPRSATLDALVLAAERASVHTCEVCGTEGQIHKLGGRLEARCPQHSSGPRNYL